VRRSIEARTAEVEAVNANRRDLIVNLTAEIARNYFELHGTQHQLEVARRNAANQQETLNITLVRLAGVGTPSSIPPGHGRS
jgi:outer membrane protein, multidrug efflux system